MRRFVLVRAVDVTGVSGVGAVVWGLVYPDGRVSYRWNTRLATTCTADSIDDVIAIHGHDGATVLRWLDDEQDADRWQQVEAGRGCSTS